MIESRHCFRVQFVDIQIGVAAGKSDECDENPGKQFLHDLNYFLLFSELQHCKIRPAGQMVSTNRIFKAHA